MSKYASKDPVPLNDIAYIDQETIDQIAEQIEVPGAVWGAIKGTLSAQTDLNNALSDKVATSHLSPHAPSDAASIASIKNDSDISDAISKKHNNTLDHSHSNKSVIDNIQESLTTSLKTGYDGAVIHAGLSHAPSNAQKNSDITKAEIEAKLTGEISSHSHAGGGGDGEVSVVLTQDQSTNSASYVDVAGMSFNALANSTYIVEFFLVFQSNNITYGIGYGINGPASPDFCVGHVDLMLAASTRYVNNITAYNLVNATSASVVAINTNYPGYVWVLIKTGANGGAVTLRQRSENASGTITTKAGSTLRYRKVA